MFRVLAFTLTLALSAGPSAGLFCHVLCADHPAPSLACHEHGAGTTTVRSAAGDCDASAAIARLPGTFRLADSGAGTALPATLPTLGHPSAAPQGFAATDARRCGREHRPLQTILRI